MNEILNPEHSAAEAVTAFAAAYVFVTVGGYVLGRMLRKRYMRL